MVLLKKADGVEEDDEDGYRRKVTHEDLPGEIESWVDNFELGLRAFGRHEPTGKERNEDTA